MTLKKKSGEFFLQNFDILYFCDYFPMIQVRTCYIIFKSLVKKLLRISTWQQRNIKLKTRFFWPQILCDHMGHIPMKPALIQIKHFCKPTT